MNLDQAYKYCKNIVKSNYENFPVGLFVPKNIRNDVFCIYAFARTADNFADEDKISPEVRVQKLNEWEKMLHECFEGSPKHPIFTALRSTINKFNIPIKPMQDLLIAFKMDVQKQRHNSFDELLTYCSYSANPIGRLMLLLSGIRNPKIIQYSDKICTALQMTNFWQDISLDLKKNRIYLPLEDLKKFKYSENDLFDNNYNSNFCNLLKYQVDRTSELFEEGRPLITHLQGRLKFEIILTYLGGKVILNKIKTANYNIFEKRPILNLMDKIILFLNAGFRWMMGFKKY